MADKLNPVQQPSNRMYHRPQNSVAATRSQYGFQSHEWASEALGTIFTAYREAYGKSIDDVAQDLCLRRAHVRALENGSYADLPAASYSTGFVRSYAKYLGLPAEEMAARCRDGYTSKAAATSLPAYSPHVGAGTVAYSPRWPSFAVLAIAAVLLGLSYTVMSAYTRAVNPQNDVRTTTIPADIIEIDEDIVPLNASDAVVEEFDNITGNIVYGVTPHDERPANALAAAPAPMPVDQPYRVIIRATGRALITVFDAQTGREFLREEYQNGDEYAVPDDKIVSLLSQDVTHLEIIIDGVAYRILSSIAQLERPLVLDPDQIVNSRELTPVQAQ